MDIRATLKPSRFFKDTYVLRVNGVPVRSFVRPTLGRALDAARAYLSGDNPWQLP